MEKVVVKKISNRSGNNFLISLITGLILVLIILFSSILFSFSLLEIMLLVLVSMGMFLILQYVLMNTSRKIDSITEIKKYPLDTRVSDVSRAAYIGSTQTRTYHAKSCRLAKLIKPRYKLSDDNPNFFKSKKFKACKICLKKTK